MNIETDNGVDKAAVEHIKSLLDDSYAEVLGGYLTDAALYIDQIAAALQQGNITAAGEVAHKLKSSSGQFGFRAMQNIAIRIERPEGKSAAALLDEQAQLKAAYDMSVQFLHKHSLMA